MKLSRIKNRLYKNFLAGLAIGVGILTSALLAVSVTGTFNTFSSGTLLKSSDINANFATLKTAIEGIPSQPAMRLIYETDVPSATNTVTVSGLDGNSDAGYIIQTTIVSNTASGCDNVVRPNNDSTTANYASLGINASTSSVTQAYYSTFAGFRIGSTASASGDMVSCRSYIYSKTGLRRQLIADCFDIPNGSGAGDKTHYGGVWTNTATNITSLTFFSSCASGIGAGSHIEVWARR